MVSHVLIKYVKMANFSRTNISTQAANGEQANKQHWLLPAFDCMVVKRHYNTMTEKDNSY